MGHVNYSDTDTLAGCWEAIRKKNEKIKSLELEVEKLKNQIKNHE